MHHIRNMQDEIEEVKTQTKHFNNKECAKCPGEKLELPTINFMCGHSFNVRCVDMSQGGCPKCQGERADV
jgi:hypothetical protein